MKKLIVLIISAVLFSTLAVVASAENIEYFYVNSETGNDRATAYDADNAVKTFTQACRYAEEAGVDKAYIVITNEYAMPGVVKEISHKVPFVITTKDAKTDYAKENGAKFVFGKNLRYILNGDTAFENIAIDYSGSLNCVAQYNHITFGENVTTTCLDGESSNIYIVGGWQSPEDDFDSTRDTHITIKSGSFLYVIGGCRQVAEQGNGLTLTGTHYIDIAGGEIANLFGASYAHNWSQSTIINMSGGKVGQFYVAGDVTRRLNGDATLTLTGGEISTLYVNNVVGNATVNLLGTKVGSIGISYASDEIASLATKAKSQKTLVYDANYYTDAEIESYIGFDTKKNNAVLFVKEGATGNGLSESTPTSLDNAIKVAAENNAVITVIGKLTIGSFTEITHANAVTVTGKDNSASIEVKGTYTLSGETVFDGIKISGNFGAENGLLAATENTTANVNISGNATLAAGNIGMITNAGNVVVNGATVESIIGGNKSASIEIHSGKVGTVKSTDTSINDFSLTVSGGSVDKVVFNNVVKALSYTLMGGEVKAYEVVGNNVSGSLTINEQLFTKDSLGTAAVLFTKAGEKVFFLADGGKGSGASVSSPAASLDAAYAVVGESGGTIVICGPFTVATAFNTSTNKGKITFTSVYDGVDYAKTSGAKMLFTANFYCGGETEFNNITLKNNAHYRSIYANTHKLVLGDNITSYADDVNNSYMSVMGGNQGALTDMTTDITINSGIWQKVRGGTAADGSKNTDINIVINGGRFVDIFTLGSSLSHNGDITATINGGVFEYGVYAATLTKDEHYFNSNVNLTINGGTFHGTVAPANSIVGTYSGAFNVTVNGGDFARLIELKGTEGIGSMISTLNVSGVDINAPINGTYTYTNYLRTGADPFMFYNDKDGWYYYMATSGNVVRLLKTANFADLTTCMAATIYDPADGYDYSTSLWAPEIHYLSKDDVGEEYAGWYLYVGGRPADTENTVLQRLYVLKCLDGDNLMGRWGNPVTGEVNVPQLIELPGTKFNTEDCTGDASFVEINGKKYFLCFTTHGRNTEEPFRQSIVIADIENPWTFTNASEICFPEYDYEKGGSSKNYPQVVEGPDAVYANDGTVYIAYSGSGYWTTQYCMSAIRYKGGEPKDISSWEKLAKPYLSKSDKINGCGHAYFFKDAVGQEYIIYHAYIGNTASGSRYIFIEPYTADKNGIVIGNGSGHPASVETVQTAALNPLPFAKRITGFDSVDVVATTTVKLTIGSTTAYINGVAQTLDAAPINRNNRTMLPVRFLANAFGVPNEGIKWDAATRTATLINATTTIVVTIDAPTMTVNGAIVALDSPAIIESNRTYLPVRAIANALGVSNDNIAWDSATNTATLVK